MGASPGVPPDLPRDVGVFVPELVGNDGEAGIPVVNPPEIGGVEPALESSRAVAVRLKGASPLQKPEDVDPLAGVLGGSVGDCFGG